MYLKYAKMLAIVLLENMKLGDNTLSNERLCSCKHNKILVNCSSYYAALHLKKIETTMR